MEAHASEMPQLPHLLAGGCLGGVQPGTTRGRQRRPLWAQTLVLGVHPQHPSTQTTRERRAIPQPPCLQGGGPLAQARPPPPLAPEPALETSGRTGACLLQGFQGPGPRPLGLGVHRGHLPHTPPVPCALRLAYQPADQLADVHSLTLGSTLAPLACHGGGIHHGVGEPLRRQKPGQPATFPARCRATHHWRGVGEAQALCGLRDFVEHVRLVARVQTPLTWLLTMPRGATALPGFFAQLKGHTQDMLSGGSRRMVGRCGPPGLSPPG